MKKRHGNVTWKNRTIYVHQDAKSGKWSAWIEGDNGETTGVSGQPSQQAAENSLVDWLCDLAMEEGVA